MLIMFVLDSMLEAPPGHVDNGDAYTAQEEDTSQQSGCRSRDSG